MRAKLTFVGKSVFFFYLIFIPFLVADDLSEECTIGVANGNATSDGRPLLWKTRDNADDPDNEIYFNTLFKYHFISLVKASDTLPWMGVNEKGFAILNSQSQDLPAGSSGMGNGSFMRFALGTCASLQELERLLDSTNVTGRFTQANFGVIDSTGAAAIYETSGNNYWKFDTNDSLVAPYGYLIRTNFAIHGGGKRGIERFNRSNKLIDKYYQGDSLNYKSILRYHMRDFSDEYSRHVPVPFSNSWFTGCPYGYIYTELSICRNISVAATVIQGVAPGEKASLSVMLTLLGQPAASVFLPYWPLCSPPPASNGYPTAPICNIANQIRSHVFDYHPNDLYLNSFKLLDGNQGGLWTHLFPLEDSILHAFDSKNLTWRENPPDVQVIKHFEDSLASVAYTRLNQINNGIISSVVDDEQTICSNQFQLCGNYPNPFNSNTKFKFYLPEQSDIELDIFAINGSKVKSVFSGRLNTGWHEYGWDGTDTNNNNQASGLYLFRLKTNHFIKTIKTLMIK